MCLLTYFPAGVQPDCELLHNGTITNQDGHGFAIVARRRLIVRHGMNAADMIDGFAKLRRQHPSGPALFHSRFGTGGKYNQRNCHPFRFGGDRRTVVAHNGVSLNKAIVPDHRCDTRIAAEEILPARFGHLGSAANRAKLAKWVGPWNKLVILTVNPAYRSNAFLINESSGEWDNGIWYSNDGYLPMARYHVGRQSSDGLNDCEFCGSWATVDHEYGICEECHTCTECGQLYEDAACGCDRLADDDSYDYHVPWYLQPGLLRNYDLASLE